MKYTKKSVIKKFNSLCLGELAAAISFVFDYYLWVRLYNINGFLIDYISIYILIFILLQGSFFWFYMRRKALRKKYNKIIFTLIYRFFNYFNIIVIVSAYICNLFLQGHLFLNMFVITFALIEFINYYYTRLSYPPKEFISKAKAFNFRRSRLYRELRS